MTGGVNNKKVTRILLCDDHPLLLSGIRAALEMDGGFEVVGTAVSGAEVIPRVGQLSPELVLLDVRLPHLDGIGCLVRLRQRFPEVKVVMLSMFAEAADVEAAFREGACGYIIKSIDATALPEALRQAIHGAAYHAVGVVEEEDSSVAREMGLTERELTTIKAVARGLSNDAIAKELWVTEQTVKFHLTNVYRKLGVANRTEAARWAFAQGLVHPPPAAAVPRKQIIGKDVAQLATGRTA